MTSRSGVPWFSLAFVAVTVAIQAATEFDGALYPALERHLATDWDALARFELYRPLVSPLLQTSPGFLPTIIGLTTIAVPLFEFRAGAALTMFTFFGGDWLSTLPTLVVMKVAGAFGSATAERLAASPDSGASSGAFACLAALACTLPPRWAIAVLGMLGAGLGARILLWHRLYDFQHLLAACAGVALWWMWRSIRSAPQPPPGLPL